ncbi:MAG: lysylphosphatidylglycerol synthase transmembrane domain-containing protein [Jatrophihabitantaceae bacterium]
MTTNPAVLGAPSSPTRRRWVRPALSGLVSLVIVVGIFWYFIPQFTSMSKVWAAIRAMTWLELATLALAAIWNLATYLFVMVAATPGLKYRQAFVATETSTAVSNTLPGGGAVGIALTYSMFGSWGFSRSRTSVSLVVAGIWNNFAKLGMPILALSLLALQGRPSGGRVVAASVGLAALAAAVAALAMLLRSEATARRLGLFAAGIANRLLRVAGRPPVEGWERATVKFRGRTQLLVNARWIWISVSTLISHLSLFLVLLLALRHIGVPSTDVGWVEALAVFSFARLLTAIPITPGGLGVVEVALITGLAAAGGARAQVAAAVLLFRGLTYVVPIPLGLATYLYYKRNRSWLREPGKAPRTALVPETT